MNVSQQTLLPADVRIFRITRIVDIVRLWAFFREGIVYEAKYLRYAYPLEVYRKILFHLVKSPKGWVGVVTTHELEPLAFVMAHDITPLFADEREFEVSMFYYKKGFRQCICLLQDHLERFCRENGIRRYYLSTSSFCSSATRIFKESWIGLERSNTVFKRKVF